MIYDWICNHCRKGISVIRSVNDREVPPREDERFCTHPMQRRTVNVPVIKRTDLRDANYPMNLKIEGRQHIFSSYQDQVSWMDRNGYVFTEDATTPETWNGSQRNVFDKFDVDTPPPGVRDRTSEAVFSNNPEDFGLRPDGEVL